MEPRPTRHEFLAQLSAYHAAVAGGFPELAHARHDIIVSMFDFIVMELKALIEERDGPGPWGRCNDCGQQIGEEGSYTHCYRCSRLRDYEHENREAMEILRELVESDSMTRWDASRHYDARQRAVELLGRVSVPTRSGQGPSSGESNNG